ncbi:hypothetical protein R1sor_019077 [Riccia sorocarpa]|uniref:Gag protein n=1 Tax=Riccia sorocarpa TaxID=122646 RepID=A0ABD3IBI0_9MARC
MAANPEVNQGASSSSGQGDATPLGVVLALDTVGFLQALATLMRRYKQLSMREKIILDVRRTELFLQAVDDVSADRLCYMLADKGAESGLSLDWTMMEDAVAILTRQKRAIGVNYGALHPFPEPSRVVPNVVVPQPPPRAAAVSAPVPVAAPVPAAAPAQVPAPAPRDQRQRRQNRGQQNVIDDLTQQLRDLRVEMTGLRRDQSPVVDNNRPRNFGPRRCIWCDSLDHLKGECQELTAAIRDGIVRYQEGMLHLVATEMSTEIAHHAPNAKHQDIGRIPITTINSDSTMSIYLLV